MTNLFETIDNELMALFHLTEEQYENMCENATDEELDLITKMSHTFTEKKEVVQILNKYRNDR